MIRWIKYKIACRMAEKMSKQFNEDVDEDFRQKWTFCQGQMLTRGRLKWNWRKIWGEKKK